MLQFLPRDLLFGLDLRQARAGSFALLCELLLLLLPARALFPDPRQSGAGISLTGEKPGLLRLDRAGPLFERARARLSLGKIVCELVDLPAQFADHTGRLRNLLLALRLLLGRRFERAAQRCLPGAHGFALFAERFCLCPEKAEPSGGAVQRLAQLPRPLVRYDRLLFGFDLYCGQVTQLPLEAGGPLRHFGG